MDNRHSPQDEAKKVIAERNALEPKMDDTIEDAERTLEERGRWDRVKTAMETLSHEANCYGSEFLAKAMFYGMHNDHRTLQAMVVNAMLKFMGIYSGASYDLRNKAAVEAAEKLAQVIKDEGVYIPLI